VSKVRCALVGCGVVAHQYATTLSGAEAVDLHACVDLDEPRARAFAARYGIPRVATLTELLAERAVDLVVVLTQPEAHLTVARAVVSAGVSVYVEKPIGLDVAEAAALLELADVNGVLVGGAPDTFLGPPTSVALAAIDAGLIGTPVAATGMMLSAGPEGWHPAPEPFYAEQAGPLFDMGPYYLTTLVELLGPVHRVASASAFRRADRITGTGIRFSARSPTHVSCVLEHESGAASTLVTSFDVVATRHPNLEIHGTSGTLVLPDPNRHTGPVYTSTSDGSWRELPQSDARPTRGVGVLDIAHALRTGTPHRATGRRALHVLETLVEINYRCT
jgi:predicted dehydrogenase